MDQERKAICQALSREVGRMHRKTACRNDGNTARQRHSWDEAFAQVMLAQQESIAQLMTLYEAVRSQTEEALQQVLGHGYGQPDHQLEALHQEHGLGQAHMKKDREGLIQELRGSMYSLLGAFKGDYTQQAVHYEQRMLHLQNTFQAQLASSSPVQAVSDQQPGLQDDLQYGQMAYAVCNASDDDSGRSRSTSRGRSRTRSRKQTPEPPLRSPALSGKSPALLRTPMRGAVAAKSPRAAVVSPRTAVNEEACLQELQDHLGGAGSLQCVPWVPAVLQGEWGLLQDQLAQTEAALRAEQHSCELLREEADESKGCAVQAQVQLEISHSRAERLAALVNQANQQREGRQLAGRALQRRMLHAWAKAAHHSCHETQRARQHHQAVCKIHALQTWQLSAAAGARKRLLLRTAEAHHASRLRVNSWQLWKAYTDSKALSHKQQRHAAVVHKHHMLWRCWQGWQAFMHVGWHKRAQLNTAMRHEHNSLTWRAFSSWQQQWKAYHCWLNLQQQRRLKHHLLRWHTNALLQQQWRQLSRQADRLQVTCLEITQLSLQALQS
ncbi:hypothetical protein WJX82_006277 [Trebouxia sp. C0006]